MRVQVVEVLAGGGAQTVTWDTRMLRYVGKVKTDEGEIDLNKFADLLEAKEDIADSVLESKGLTGLNSIATTFSWSYNLHQYEDLIEKINDSPFEQQITLYAE